MLAIYGQSDGLIAFNDALSMIWWYITVMGPTIKCNNRQVIAPKRSGLRLG